MRDKELLQDAMGLIDDRLILDARQHSRPHWVRWVAAAACFAVLVGCIGYWRTNKHPVSPELKIAENLWQQENFNAYSLSYKNGPATLSADGGGSIVLLGEETAPMQTENITISPQQTFKFQNFIGQRYAVYLSESGFPVFYDTAEDRELDLQERILGDTSHILTRYKELVFQVAYEQYAPFMASEANRQILDLYITYYANDTLSQRWSEITAITPDIAFMDSMPEYWNLSDELKRQACWNMPWQIHFDTWDLWEQEPYDNDPYVLKVLGMDETNGMCIVRGDDIGGSGSFYGYYDIRTDTLKHLPDAQGNNLIGVMQNQGYTFRFFADGQIATIAWPACGFDGYAYLSARNYQGENLGVFFLEENKALNFQSSWSDTNQGIAASALYFSDNSRVCYYKKMDKALAGRDFWVSRQVWANRLTLFNRDTDIWVFAPIDENRTKGWSIELQGNFIRFAAEETLVIMERGGVYYAYDLTDGSDVTEAVTAGNITMYLHEQLGITQEKGKLYAVNLFTGESQLLGDGDQYILTEDGAFAFAYCQGQEHVTCYNVASGEAYEIQIDPVLCNQLFSGANVVLQMSHDPRDNTFLISYYLGEDVPETEPVDFYNLLGQLQPNPNFPEPANPNRITALTVSEDIMDAFREGAYRYDHPDGVIYWYTYYPDFLTFYEDRHSIFSCLGLTEPEDYLAVNGTEFILYENENEQLRLIFWEDWLLYDYTDWHSGFHIEYSVGSRVYRFEFLHPNAQTQ